MIKDSDIKNVKSYEGDTGLGSFGQCIDAKIWFNVFLDTLNNQDKWPVKTAKSNRIFCFGDWVELKAIKAVKFPVTLEQV